jgi:predicted acylesterase/phospholipase RssA
MIKNLVISGGGVKIIGAIGVIKYLDENNLLKSVENFYGTSAGSILCLMLILNFNSCEIIKFIEDFDLNKIFLVNTDNLFTTFNVCESIKLEKVIKLFLNFKLSKVNTKISFETESETVHSGFGVTTVQASIDNFENITMIELFKQTEKYLSITSVCLNTRTAVYITHETFPNIPVWKAILMSCSIPLIFKPVEWEGRLYVDGALIDNFPLFNIESNQIKYTLGIQTCLDIQNDPFFETPDESNIYNYIVNLIKIIVESEPQIKSYNIISVKIDASILTNFLNVNLDKDIKKKIINSGYEQSLIQYPLLYKKMREISTQTDNIIRLRSNTI